MRHRIRRESHQYVIPAPNMRHAMVIKYVPENYTMDGIRCDIAIGFGQLGKIIATENTCDNLMDERELAKYIVDNETISEDENIECRR